MSDRDRILEQCSSAVWEAFATFPLLIFVFHFIYTAHISLHLQYITHIKTLATKHTSWSIDITHKHHLLGVSNQQGSRVNSAGPG